MERIHRVRSASPWGDYGRILAHGMTGHLGPTPDGRLRLERCAPFIPPATVPGFCLVVTESVRDQIEKAGLRGASFREVEKARIVAFSWEHWDRLAATPAEYPEGGEPEGYILRRPHDEGLADALGPLFQLLPLGQCTIDTKVIEHPPAPDAPMLRNPFTGEMTPRKGKTERHQRLEATDGSDFLQSGRQIFLSDRGRQLLESEWLGFQTLEK